MPILSQGFVTAPLVPRLTQAVPVVAEQSQTIVTIWGAAVSTPVKHVSLRIGQGDDKRFFFQVTDEDGSVLDVSSASQIEVRVSRRIETPALLTKLLTTGSVTLAAAGDFWINVSAVESAALPAGHLYVEIAVTLAGLRRTVGAGDFIVQNLRGSS